MVRVIRWICENCDKKWIHPIDTCLYCGKEIKKQIGKKTKVIGFTKVHIPNPLHPIVPYNVLILQDEHSNKMPKKTLKDYKIGEDYVDKPSESDDAISIIKIKYDFFEACDEALELIGGLDVNEKSKVLIKPNISIPGYAFLGMCTNPKVIESIIQILIGKKVKPDNIAIAEQSFFVPFEKAVAKSGILDIVKKYNVSLIDISKTDFEQKKERDFSFEISKITNDYDLILNIPVIKTDMNVGMCGAFENLIRFVSKKTFEDLSADPKKAVLALSVLPKLIPKFITIGDASIGEQGNGPAQYGEPGFYNLISASRNCVVHDRIMQELLCLRKLPYVELASQLGIGEFNIDKINIIGNELDAVRRDVKQPIGSKLIKKI